jgi:predicted amidohydrolase
MFHNHLSMQAGAYQNGIWVVGVAKAGIEEGVEHIGGSCIVAPTGEIVAQARTHGDELIAYDCDLNAGRTLRETTFNFAKHRRIEHYTLITERTGEIPPP